MTASLLNHLVPSLAWALLDFVWQGLLIGWITALLLGALRGARPQTRYLLACLALGACVALPLAGLLTRLADSAAAPASLLPLPLLAAEDAAGSGADSGVAAATLGQLAGWRAALQPRLPLVVLLWSAGAGLLGLRLLSGLAWVRRQRHTPAAPTPPLWQARLDALAARMGLRRPVRLVLSDALSGPVTAGCLKPLVLVPVALLSGMPAPLLEALLAHELAHVRRHDYLVNLLQSAIEVLLFYHPTVWWLSHRIRVEREQIADDLAASMLGEPRRLALALSELDLFQFSTSQLAPAAHGGKLMSRITRLVRPTQEPLNWKLALPILGLSLACTGLYAWAGNPAPAAPAAPAVAAAASVPASTPEAAPARPSKPLRAVRQTHGDGLAIVRADDKGGMYNTGPGDRAEIDKLKPTIGSDFIWFREDGKAYVVKDAATVAKARAALAPLDALSSQMEGLGAQMRVHGDSMRVLGDQMREEAAAREPERAEMRRLQQEMRRAANEQRKAARALARAAREAEQNGDSEQARAKRAAAEAAMEVARAQTEAQAEQLHVQAAARHAGQAEAIGRQMREASKPMSELGKQMGELGKQMEAESRRAEAEVRGLIQEARKAGLVQPVSL
ncbi:M56 family metallopeptidase [Massilia sp. TS11]|uniref:M56 family metallopeptidase n=1 Tax=Massilia sp. TS11 TaxID=2908003 RepID=UPI001EDADABD|nr:M56 family metallopeptidase [Massilia sp. TS11]MCG2585406.1 M56 family metallopeptidase [Massilia sp. TS11]